MSYLEDESAISRRLAERQQRKSDKSIRTHGSIAEPSSVHNSDAQVNRCIIHNKPHPTEECKLFLSLNVTDRIKKVQKSRTRYRCFKDHQMKHCRSIYLCTICNRSNHNSLLCKNQLVTATTNHSSDNNSVLLLIQLVHVVDSKKKVTVFFDSGSMGTFITHRAAKRIKAKRLRPLKLDLATTGNVESQNTTYLYEVCLASSLGKPVLDLIRKVPSLNLQVIKELFPNLDPNLFQRHSEEVDILIGAALCSLHSRQLVATAGSNLKVLEGSFGMCLHKTHSCFRLSIEQKSHFTQISRCSQVVEKSSEALGLEHLESSKMHTHLACVREAVKWDPLIQGENLGTEQTVKGDASKSGKFPGVGPTFSFREQELQTIFL